MTNFRNKTRSERRRMKRAPDAFERCGCTRCGTKAAPASYAFLDSDQAICRGCYRPGDTIIGFMAELAVHSDGQADDRDWLASNPQPQEMRTALMTKSASSSRFSPTAPLAVGTDIPANAAANPMLEVSPFEVDGGKLIGRDPRLIPAGVWAGRPWLSGMKAIRARCLDCCGYEPAEVRKCVSITCALWPLRMGAVPAGWREAVALSSESEGKDGR